MPDVGPQRADTDTVDAGDSVTDASEREMDQGVNVDAAPIDCGDLTQCGGRCADLENDVDNCGACGYTCALFNAESSCVAGSCAVDACLGDFEDNDGDPDNGCEFENLCEDGAPCDTACGTGLTQCEGSIAMCVPPEESCNARDDDCDNQCDEGQLGGCRRGIHRSYGGNLGHAYSDDLRWLTNNDFNIESQNYFYLYQEPHEGMRPVQICPEGGGKFFLNSANNCEIGRAPIAVIGFWSPTPLCNSIPLYRLYKPDREVHFYTTSSAERDRAINMLGYVSEGIAGYVWDSP